MVLSLKLNFVIILFLLYKSFILKLLPLHGVLLLRVIILRIQTDCCWLP
nr:MAG TPA: hypothetical protein [Caudoviricetes sp.]